MRSGARLYPHYRGAQIKQSGKPLHFAANEYRSLEREYRTIPMFADEMFADKRIAARPNRNTGRTARYQG
jgi:hypothetical protein